MVKIRHATETDLAGIVAVILESWRRTYAGVLPAAYRAGPVESDLAARWSGAHLERSLVLVAVEDGRVVGEERLLEEALGRIRDVRQGPDGLHYLLIDASGDGQLVRLVPLDSPASVDVVTEGGGFRSASGAGLGRKW